MAANFSEVVHEFSYEYFTRIFPGYFFLQCMTRNICALQKEPYPGPAEYIGTVGIYFRLLLAYTYATYSNKRGQIKLITKVCPQSI